MDNNQIDCQKLAERIYNLDTQTYECVGSSLGRIFEGKKESRIDELAQLLNKRPQGHELRGAIALVGNMARTVRDKEDRKRLLKEYNEILKCIEKIPSSFGSVDIINEDRAALNVSNLSHTFDDNKHLIISIVGTHGSAGTDIGFALADKLRINYLDEKIFDRVLERLEAVEDGETDKDIPLVKDKSHSVFSKIGEFISDFNRYHGLSARDAEFFNQSKLICDMSQKNDFVIVGCCADVILTNDKVPHISIFVTAPFEQRVRRMMQVHHLDYKKAEKRLKKLDQKRESYYKFYTGRSWEKPVNYDLCINSERYGIDEAVELICRMINGNEQDALNNELK